MKIQKEITQKLILTFQPVTLDVLNESHQHSVPQNSETHFKVIVVSEQFKGLSLIQRHRAIYEALKKEIAQGVHALAIHAMTPEEWNQKKETQFKSPPCLGGSSKD
jgi:BolA protein